MNHELYLDLSWESLVGWQSEIGDLSVDAICRGIEEGDEFPPVSVVALEDGSYSLDLTKLDPDIGGRFLDGGHARAVAHYIMNEPLKCILNPKGLPHSISARIPILEIIITDDNGEYVSRKLYHPNYR